MKIRFDKQCLATDRAFSLADDMRKYFGTTIDVDHYTLQHIKDNKRNGGNCVSIFNFNWHINDIIIIDDSIEIEKGKSVLFDVSNLSI